MDRDRDRDDAFANGEETVREGNLVIEEGINRREGLVEYEGTVGEGSVARNDTAAVTDVTRSSGTVDQAPSGGVLGGAMQAGATVLGGVARTEDVGTSAPVAEETTVGASTREMDPLSMSTDNSASGLMSSDTIESGPITQVREGMRVIDAGGDELGKVESIRMGDPSAITTQGEEAGGDGSGFGGDAVPIVPAGGGTSGSTGLAGAPGGAGVFAGVGGGGDEPDLPETLRNELVRVGYVKIDGKGWFGRDYYASADQIGEVSGDMVRLTVAKDALPT